MSSSLLDESREQKLAAFGFSLPVPAVPVANYVSYRRVGSLLVISGQLCLGMDGVVAAHHKGKLGASVSIESGKEAASLCALQLLAQAKAALGSLEAIKSCVRLGGFIAATPDFVALAQVMNGASDLMVGVLGEAGKHARSTIGVASLPLDCAVEVEALFEC